MRSSFDSHSIAWLLYAVMLMVLPTPHLLFVVVGLAPLTVMARWIVRGAPTTRLGDCAQRYVMIAVFGGNMVVLGVILYLAAANVSRLLFWAFARKLAGLLMAGM